MRRRDEAVLALLGVLAVALVVQQQQRGAETELLLRDAGVSEAMGRPEQRWSGSKQLMGLYDNMGAANMGISQSIKALDATRSNPNLAAAVRKMQDATEESRAAISDLHDPMAYGHQLPDPDGFMKRLHAMRSSSSWCKTNPKACAPLMGGAPAQTPAEAEAAAGLRSAAMAAAAAAGARMQSLALGTQQFHSGDFAGMPWLEPYQERDMHRAAQAAAAAKARAPWTVVHTPRGGNAVVAPGQEADPLWCGGSACADKGFARHQHSWAQNMGRLVHNVPAVSRHGSAFNKAPVEQLAEVDALTGGSGGRTAAGKGDSLLPHGPLWGLKGARGGGGGPVRYHEYPGWYEGTQADRAATESPEQAAGEAYALETKELGVALRRIKAARGAGREAPSAYKRGEAAMKEASTGPGRVALPGISKLARTAAGLPSRAGPLPAIRGVSMDVLGHEGVRSQLEEEEDAMGREQGRLSKLAEGLSVQ